MLSYLSLYLDTVSAHSHRPLLFPTHNVDPSQEVPMPKFVTVGLTAFLLSAISPSQPGRLCHDDRGFAARLWNEALEFLV